MKFYKNLKVASGKQGIFWEARTRILAWYLAIISGLFVLSLPLVTRSILFQVNLQVRQDIVEELEAFNNFQQHKFSSIETSDELKLAQLFQDFLNSKIAEDDTFFITIIDGQYYRSNLPPRSQILAVESPLIQHWQKLKKPRSGEWLTSDPAIDRILYFAQPIIIRGEVKGVIVVAHTTAEEIKKATDVVRISKRILLIVLLLSVVAAWIASGKVLKPLQQLSQTVSSIDESDLERRIPVTGTGEIAQLTERFNQMMERLQKVFRSQRELLNETVPIIILTARDDIQDKLAGLEGGADDYMTKPFRFEELLARIRLRMRTPQASNSQDETILTAKDLTLNLLTRKVTFKNKPVELSEREFTLLETFIRHQGQVMSRQQLLDWVWGYDYDPGSNIVDVYVGYLRKKLNSDAIATVRGIGYQFTDN